MTNTIDREILRLAVMQQPLCAVCGEGLDHRSASLVIVHEGSVRSNFLLCPSCAERAVPRIQARCRSTTPPAPYDSPDMHLSCEVVTW